MTFQRQRVTVQYNQCGAPKNNTAKQTGRELLFVFIENNLAGFGHFEILGQQVVFAEAVSVWELGFLKILVSKSVHSGSGCFR